MKKCYFDEEFKGGGKYYEQDLAVLELENSLEEKYGYMGIDMGEENMENLEEMEVFGYPAGKNNTM